MADGSKLLTASKPQHSLLDVDLMLKINLELHGK